MTKIRELPTDEQAIREGCEFHLPSAEKVRKFFRQFVRHSKGEWAGKPFEFLDWQWTDVIGPLFGWLRPDGTRRFRRAYIEIPKKQGKSALASGLAIYLLVGDSEAGAEVYSAAADREQASIVFNEAANMVEASPGLSKHLEVVRSQKRLVFSKKQSWFKALSADVPTKEGLNIHGLLFDELHAQVKRDLWDTLAYGGAARRQPLSISITTAGYDRESICWEQHQYAQSVLEGRNPDTSFLPCIYAASESDDWTSPATWAKANPSFGVTIKESEMAEACREAQQSPAKQNSFRRYRLNQWTEQDVRWLDLARWDECSGLTAEAQAA